MASVNKTPNYNLNQWGGNEYVKRQDFVDDNLNIDTAIKSVDNSLAAYKADNVQRFENIEQQLEDGTAGIDDSVISDSKVWSSSKTQQEIGNLINIPSTVYTSDIQPPNPNEGDIWFKIISSVPEIPVEGYLFRFDASELQLDDGANVSIWDDMSNNNYNLTPTTTEPVFLKTGFNGKPTVHLNCIRMGFNSIPLSDLNNGTLIVVSEFNSTPTSSTVVAGLTYGAEISAFALRYSSSGGGLMTLRIVGVQAANISSGNSPSAYITTLNNQKGSIYKNGIKGSSDPTSTSIPTNGRNISIGSDAFDGKISEVIYYERGLSEQEITELNSYLMQKWGI